MIGTGKDTRGRRRCAGCGKDYPATGGELCPRCSSAETPAAGRGRIGRFVLLEEVGRGAMGAVHKAWDERLGRCVALKFLRADTAAPEELSRFKREAALTARLEHPNIAPVYDVGEHEGRPFMVMKYVDGRTLEEIYVAGRRAEVADAVTVIREASLGVGYAHRAGIVHRDIKPRNIMVDRDGRVFVLDFGVARRLYASPQDLTDAIGTIGTPSYMAPEQVAGRSQDVDARTDVYGLGATLWTLLAGRPPHAAEAPIDLFLKIEKEPVPSLREIRPDVPVELERILGRAMAKRREDRHPMALNVAAELHRFLGSPARAPARAVRRVLLVEDNDPVATYMMNLLRREGIEVIRARDGEAALSADREGLALVLLDVGIPKVDGFKVLECLRSSPATRDVPVIMVTGLGGDRHIVRGLELGADDYIVKPFSSAEFTARVRRLLKRGMR